MNIAISCLRSIGRDAEEHEIALLGGFRSYFDGSLKCRYVTDAVVGRHQQNQAVRISAGGQYGCCCRRRTGVASEWLEHNGSIPASHLTELLRNQESVLRIGNNERCSEKRRSGYPL